jgi:hypothetical protein
VEAREWVREWECESVRGVESSPSHPMHL